MFRGTNGRRHRYVPRIRRRRRGLQRGGVLLMLAMALSPWAFKKKRQRRARRRLSDLSQEKKSRHVCFALGRTV